MPNVQQFAVTALANASVTVPRFQMTGIVTDDHGNTVFDFTGANAITFPDDLIGKLNAADRQAFVELIKLWLVGRISARF